MEENNHLLPAETEQKNGCINCGNPAVLHGYPNALCESCRDSFVTFKMPLWVKLFAAGIGIIFLFSIYKIPGNINLGLRFEKGKTAITEKKYLTAQKELEAVANALPDYLEASGYLLIASFHNQDFVTMGKAFDRLKNENIDNDDLLKKIDVTLKSSENYFPTDSFNIKVQSEYGNDFDSIPDNILKQYAASHDEVYPRMGYVGRLSDQDKYTACDSLLQLVIEKQPDFMPALVMMASVKRQENQFDESISYCNRALSINKESVQAIASKSRTFLKEKKDKEALDLAKKSYHMDERDAYAAGSLILVYHFTNNSKEKEALIKNVSAWKDSASIQTLRYVMDVINGKEFFRN